MAAVSAFSLDSAALAGVWTADALGREGAGTIATGHALLDAELPDGGWPLGALIELLQPAPTTAIWPLLGPALARRLRPAAGLAAGEGDGAAARSRGRRPAARGRHRRGAHRSSWPSACHWDAASAAGV